MHKLLMWALLTRAKSTARTTTEGASLLTRFPPLMIHWKYLVSTTWACRSRSCHWCSGKYTPQHNYCSLKKKLIVFPCTQMGKIQATSGRWQKQISESSSAWAHAMITTACHTQPWQPEVDPSRTFSPRIQWGAVLLAAWWSPERTKLWSFSNVLR